MIRDRIEDPLSDHLLLLETMESDFSPRSLSFSWVCLGEESASDSTTLSSFFQSVSIWIYRPNVIYKRLSGALITNKDGGVCAVGGSEEHLLQEGGMVLRYDCPSYSLDREMLSKSSSNSSFERVVIGSYHK